MADTPLSILGNERWQATAPSAAETGPSGPYRVLLVEDSEADARLVREYLREIETADFELVHAETLGEARELLAGDDFDVALLDLSLPDSAASETFPAFNGLPDRPPVVLLTGMDDEELAAELVRSGAEEYLPKGVLRAQPLARSMRHAMERAALEQQLRIAQRHRVVADLTGGIAHHFNNLLTVILGEAQLAAAQIEEDSPVAESLGAIEEAATRASGIGRQLLLLSRHRQEEPQATELGALLEDVRPLLGEVLGDSHELSLRVPDEEAWVVVDRFRLRMVLVSLALNASEAMGESGELTLEVLAEEPAHGSRLPAWTIRVVDTGPGIPESTRAQVFEPFFTTKAVDGASGLGLTVARYVLERHGGAIEVEPDHPHTAIRLTLPRRDPDGASG